MNVALPPQLQLDKTLIKQNNCFMQLRGPSATDHFVCYNRLRSTCKPLNLDQVIKSGFPAGLFFRNLLVKRKPCLIKWSAIGRYKI